MSTNDEYTSDEYLKLQQQAYAPIATQQGLMGGLLGLGNALGGWSGANYASTQYYQQYATQSIPNPSFGNYGILEFHRINRKVSISERNIVDGRFEEPLDELRIKVSRWLDN